ncbi:hypothetical protein RSSM_00661 [Rhodopirellula sallentina SM41]|uniref:Uncharacterized protein n=1 Tax=Rhodopirellula sallentina SM41 TaxID=1263870 RepID=M5UPF3_9BACT|nr:hypothetical protein RSSM_00661 [Rhodopirellula sallentina SM41]
MRFAKTIDRRCDCMEPLNSDRTSASALCTPGGRSVVGLNSRGAVIHRGVANLGGRRQTSFKKFTRRIAAIQTAKSKNAQFAPR